jgi:hypothetical protein
VAQIGFFRIPLECGNVARRYWPLLMDTNQNGKISKQEFMSFMEAEFDRLDTDKSGELDPKELTQSRIRAARPAIGK